MGTYNPGYDQFGFGHSRTLCGMHITGYGRCDRCHFPINWVTCDHGSMIPMEVDLLSGKHDCNRTTDPNWMYQLHPLPPLIVSEEPKSIQAPFGEGDLINHPKFGMGRVLWMESSKFGMRFDVEFQEVGEKKLLYPQAPVTKVA